jgi:hypothetical protein
LAKVVVISEVDPRELGTVLDKVLGENSCPIIRGIPSMIKVSGGVVNGPDLGEFLKTLGVDINPPKQNPESKNNKGGKQ